MKIPDAPASLSVDAKRMWGKLLRELGEWEDSQLLIVRTGLEQWDLMQEARRQIKADGLMVPDRFGQLKQHPCTSVVRDNANGVRAMYKLLGLDLTEADE